MSTPIPQGTRLGHYEIRSRIGAGGMGEVYLARDLQLDRTVALKILLARMAQTSKGLSRFTQEARSASKLNHPNVSHIYELGEQAGYSFIAMEYVEGKTLRQLMSDTELDLETVLDIGAQVANALAAAHAAGIVHRDIKPENIMVRTDGLVKVLDFGIARNTVQQSALPEAPTVIDTNPGVVLGTSFYMSPEQVRGLEVDARADIWSLGIVLFEMLTGQVPFEGETPIDVALAILDKEPPALSDFVEGVPESLDELVAKALRKDKEERQQTARELLADLRRLHHRLKFGETRERYNSSESNNGRLKTTGYRKVPYDTARKSAARTKATGDVRGLKSVWASLKRSRSIALALAVVIILMLGIGFALYKYAHRRASQELLFQQTKLSKLTATGKTTRAVISPDGRYIAYVMDEGGQQSLWLKQVMIANSNLERIPLMEIVYRGLTFSPDGNYIYYVAQEKNNPIQVLYQVAVLQGEPRRVLVNIDSPVSFSPDGSRFAFVRRQRDRGEDVLMIANADGTAERSLFTRSGNDFFSIGGPAWSPDGETVACAAGTKTGGRSMSLVQVRVADGVEQPISSGKWSDVGRIAWLPDMSGLFVVATETGSTLSQVWHLSYPYGAARKVTNDLTDYRDLSLTSDSRSLATVRLESRINVWTNTLADVGRARQITSGIGQDDGVKGIAWTPDGRIVYVSKASGSQDIWTMQADGTNPRQLTTPATRADVYPSVTPDGRYIIFVSNREGNSNIWRMALDGSSPTRLTDGSGEEFPNCSPDGKWVVYTETGSSRFSIWKVAVEGGPPAQITDRLSQWPVVSRDGKLIACWYREDSAQPWRIAVIPFEGGQPLKMFDVPATVSTSIPVRWSPDGRAVTYIETVGGVSNIWSQPLVGGPTKLTDFKSDQILWFDWSHDGRQLAFARGNITSDVVLISDSK
ncbi:MAG TPA: protein kinase [Pyrinomonadaceae bacterium]|jgi:serine/threonine protein kinase/Tol biopolymer transport system component